MRHRLNGSVFGLASLALFLLSTVGHAQTSNPQPATPPQTTTTITCSSRIGERQECAADTSRGVVLQQSHGESACLLGKTWGYTDQGVWVADGCVGDFIVGPTVAGARDDEEGADVHPQRGLPHRRARKGRDVRAALQLRALSESEGPRRDLHGCVRERPHRAAAPGRAAAEVLPALQRAGSSRRSSATTSTSGRRIPRRAIPRRSSAAATSATSSTST